VEMKKIKKELGKIPQLLFEFRLEIGFRT